LPFKQLHSPLAVYVHVFLSSHLTILFT
jgi:hypothetical protein